MWRDGDLLGKTGSEGGEVVLDEIHEYGCRISLEKVGEARMITCGVFGAFCHTAFAPVDGVELYNKMKTELQEFMVV